MPRYFLDIYHNGHELPDEEGIEVPCLATARAQALDTVSEIVRDVPPHYQGSFLQMKVGPEDGRPLITVSLSLRVEQHSDGS